MVTVIGNGDYNKIIPQQHKYQPTQTQLCVCFFLLL